MNDLKAVKSFVLKNRPAYKDYLGRKEERIKLIEGTWNEDGTTVQKIVEPNFKNFELGEQYLVVIDGVEMESHTFKLSSYIYLSSEISIMDIQDKFSNDETAYAFVVFNGELNTDARGDYLGKSFSVYRAENIERYDIKKLPEDCLPDSVAASFKRIEESVESALRTAEEADAYADDAYQLASSAGSVLYDKVKEQGYSKTEEEFYADLAAVEGLAEELSQI